MPLSGVLPYPTDLYFSGSTDGTLNMPTTPFLPNAASVNALDGFSTVATATARFSAPIDPLTISASTVIVLEVDVDNATKATVGFRRALVYGTDYTARVQPTLDSNNATLEIVPLKPLTPSTGATNVGYLVILTNGLHDTAGNAATPDRDYLTITAGLADVRRPHRLDEWHLPADRRAAAGRGRGPRRRDRAERRPQLLVLDRGDGRHDEYRGSTRAAGPDRRRRDRLHSCRR